MTTQRFLVHLSRTEHHVVDPEDIYLVEANGDESLVRLRGRDPLVDSRPLGDLEPILTAAGILRIHRQHAVNPARIHTLRRQADGRDWEVKLEPPVNAVLPVARDSLAALRNALGE
jgi:DNA-binding LytR/AlgR family response regulator